MKNKLISILKALFATLLFVIGIELIGLWCFIAEAIEFKNYIEYYALIQGTLQLIAVFLFIYFKKNRTFKKLIDKIHYRWYLIAVILGISFSFIQTPLNWIYNLFFENEYHIAYRFDGLPKFKNLNFIAAVLFIPIAEELFFRSYIQNNLQKKFNAINAILLTALLFALIHSPYTNLLLDYKKDWHRFYTAFFGGTLSGILYFKSKSIGPSIVFHMFWNLMSIII